MRNRYIGVTLFVLLIIMLIPLSIAEESVNQDITEQMGQEAIAEETAVPEEMPIQIIESDIEVEKSEAPPDIDLTSVTVTVRMLGGTDLQYGQPVSLVAEVSGLEKNTYYIRWESREDAESNWREISGVTALIYTFTLNEENALLEYRAVVVVTA